MNVQRTPQQLFDEQLLEMRAKVLELAAALDRVDRADGSPAASDSVSTLRTAIETLLRPGPNRAEQIQLLFSRPYEDRWRETMNV